MNEKMTNAERATLFGLATGAVALSIGAVLVGFMLVMAL